MQQLETDIRIRPLQPLEVLIPTATVIAYQSENPHLILVGESRKHGKPVLPGGKIDQQDLISTSLERCAAACIVRELREEAGAEPLKLSLLGVSADSERDVRSITVGALAGSIVENLVRNLPTDSRIIGRHGVPDFLFASAVDPASVVPSDELKNLRWIDCREVIEGSLGAGHDAFVARYAAKFRNSI